MWQCSPSFRRARMAGGAEAILVPEVEIDYAELGRRIVARHEAGHDYSLVVVAEGATPAAGDMVLADGNVDAFGHVRLGGIGDRLAKEIEDRTGHEARAVVLGHVQRGGTPTAFDRWLATRFGLHAIEAVHDGDFGTMMALKGTEIVRLKLIEGTGELKLVTPELYAEAAVFFG